MAKCVLAFSGGLDTLVAIAWLKERRNFDVVALAVNVGQGEDLEELGEIALRAGAISARVEDLRETFFKDYIANSLRALAHYEQNYLLASALSRPLIARELVRVAQEEGATHVAHGCSGKGNDQIRFEAGITALAPSLKIIAPLREWEYKNREERIKYAQSKRLMLPAQKSGGIRCGYDLNLWGQSIECGALDDANTPPPEDAYTLSVSPLKAPNDPLEIEIEFQDGLPVGLNGNKMKAVPLIEQLNQLAGANGIGRADIIEDRLVGFKSREVYESPAATTLYIAKRGLEQMTLSRDSLQVRDGLAVAYGRCVYNGQWYSELREALDAFFERLNRNVTGTVRVRLYKGQATVTARKSECSLYNTGTSAFRDQVDNEAAEGFIRVWSLPLAAEAKRKGKK
ncbi:MAG TPA: argininosuccinate synthase [Planctomycetota bacterium]|nr:argininosuccinate synthase [Planctomycetota bacterium]